jgi:predicted GIY-YIG superfamily endonuclease
MPGTTASVKNPRAGLPPILFEGDLVSLLPLDEMAATAQHIELLNRKVNQLQEARISSWDQLLTRLGYAYDDGKLTDQDLYRLLYVVADGYGDGFTCMWNRNMPVEAKFVIGRERTRVARVEAEKKNPPNGPYGTWCGDMPLPYEGAPVPIKGIAVVYVLYDAFGEPVYHGSTNNFRVRLRAHEKDKPEAVRWVASRCEDRERAYQVEVNNLLQHLPRLNKKASR